MHNWKEALKYFPGGTQLLSKRPQSKQSQYNYSWANGITIMSNGKRYKDFSTMGIGSCILGYANQVVNEAVKDAIEYGNMSSLNSEWEIKLAKKLREYEPGKMFRYFRTGGEAIAAAVRTVRAYTGKTIILTNGYNGWHDWYLAANLNPGAHNHLNITTSIGVPQELKGTCFYFTDLKSLENLIKKYKGKIAGIVIEIARYKIIDSEIIQYLKSCNIPVIVDEITTGWRYRRGGMYKYTESNFNPDIVVYGKAISNGYPFSVICGKKEVMQAIDKTFISSTYWTDAIGPAAAYATICELEKQDYEYRDELERKIACSLIKKFKISGFNGCLHYSPNNKEKWINYMLKKGYLVTDNIYLSFSHTLKDIAEFNKVVEGYNE